MRAKKYVFVRASGIKQKENAPAAYTLPQERKALLFIFTRVFFCILTGRAVRAIAAAIARAFSLFLPY